MKNYRKAKKGEVTCSECYRVILDVYPGSRIRCQIGLPGAIGYKGYCGTTAVGKKMTCNEVAKKPKARKEST